jgi:hypothetical protein
MICTPNPMKPSEGIIEARLDGTILLNAGPWRQRFSSNNNQYLEVKGNDGLWYTVNSTLYATELANIANGTNTLSPEQ